jgi:WD40 repeat protein
VASGAGSSKPGDTNRIFDICFSQVPGDNSFVTAGAKHIKFWDSASLDGKKGIFGEGGEQTSFACVATDDQGNTYTGGANSLIYIWAERSCKQSVKAHNAGFICALRWTAGKLYSGGKDGQVNIWDTSSMSKIGSVDFGGVLIRAIDVLGSNAIVGCRNGNIYQVDLNSQSKQVIMESHSDGEVWGLAVVDQDTVVTSGDDNQLKTWSVSKRQCIARGIVSETQRKVKRGGASSLT